MDKQSKNTIQLGIFVITALALLIAAIYYMGSQQNLFGTTFKISAVFGNVDGLQLGNNVRYNGINVGSVEDMLIESDSTVRIIMALEEDMQQYIRTDATASIGSDGLVGNTIINITPGRGNKPLLKSSGSILSYSKINTNDMLKTLGNTNETIALLSLNLLELTERLNKGEGTVPKLIRDGQMAEEVQASLRHLKKTSQNVHLMSAELQQSVTRMMNGEGVLGYLLKDTMLVHNLENLTSRLDTHLILKTEPLLTNLEASSVAIRTASTELEQMMTLVNHGKGPVTALLKDSTASQEIQSILKNVEESTDKFNENMEAMRHNFLFKKYFKKQEKERKKALKETGGSMEVVSRK